MRIKLFLLLLILAVMPIAAQTEIKGTVVDADNGLPVSGATILLDSGAAATAGPNGDFLISNAKPGIDKLTVLAYGYEDFALEVNLTLNKVAELGELKLVRSKGQAGRDEDLVILDEQQMEDEEGNDQSIGMLSGSSDNIYYSTANYDFSVMRFRLRGYDSEYSQMFINGVQITDAIRGRFSYSMLGGMNQAFKRRTVDLGINNSSFTLGEIGGATNIMTSAKDYAPGFRGNLSYTNSAYTTRAMIQYSTGLNEHGWAFSLQAIGRYSKEGIIEGTFYHSGGLFASLEKVFNPRHSLGITIWGAPTQRATSSATYEEVYELVGTHMYNPNWGYQNGDKRSAKIVESFDPTAIINWVWKPKQGTELNTGAGLRYSMYSSSALNWYNAADPRPDYYRYLPSYYKENQEAFDLYTNMWKYNTPYPEEGFEADWDNQNGVRQINWDRLYMTNYLSKNESEKLGTPYRGSTYIIENRHSNQKNFYFNSTLNHRLNSVMTLQAGVGFNYTQATYYKTMRDLLGGDYWTDTDQFAERDFPGSEEMLQNDLNNPNRKIYKDDKFGYNYDINSIIANMWIQNSLDLCHFSLNYGVRGSYTQYQRDGKMRNGRSPLNSFGKGDMHRFGNAMVKAGAVYKVDGHNFFTLNASFGSRAPMANNVYIAPRVKDDVIADLENEKVLSADLSYSFNFNRVRGMITGYWTNIYDATQRSSFYDDNFSTFTNYVMTGVNKTHKGIELGIAVKVTSDFTVSAAGTFSRYQYKNRPKGTRSFENGVRADTTQTVYLKNFYVGGTPQTAFNVALNYNAPHRWYFELNGTFLTDAYIDLSPIRHEYMPNLASFVGAENYEQKVKEITNQEKLRNAFVLNASVGKVVNINRNSSLNINVSVNNLLNKRDIQTGGYQQSRFDFKGYDVSKYPNRYYYAQGIRIYANIGVRF